MTTGNESITLTAPHHDKLGSLHCGVTREGFVAVAGDTADITDGAQVEFERSHVPSCAKVVITPLPITTEDAF